MKKIIIFLSLLFVPVFVSATIDQNLYYGIKQNNEVKELQQFLIGKGFLTGSATGNFYSLTFSAVKKYQASKNINTTGYVGPLTRQAINNDLSSANSVPNSVPNSAPAGIPAPLTGSLNLLPAASYASQTVTAPQTNFKLSEFALTNNTTEAIDLKTIEIDLAIGSDLYISNLYITNLYVEYGSARTAVLSSVAHNNYWTINYQLPAGQTINLSVYGSVNSSIPLNSTVNTSLLVSGVSKISATSVSTNSNAVLAGQTITFGSSSLTVAKDSSTPLAKIFTASQRIVAGEFQFTSSGESYTISELKFIVPNFNAGTVISGAVLADIATNAILASGRKTTYSGSDCVFSFNVNVPVSLNSSKNLTIYYDLSAIVNSGSAGVNMTPVLFYVKATNSRGTIIDGVAANYGNIAAPYGGIALPGAGVAGNDIYVFKSIPVFAASSSNTSVLNNSNVNLYTFSIAADAKGEISVKQLIFTITINDPNRVYPHINKFSLLKGDKDYTSSVAIGESINNNYIGLTNDSGIGAGTHTVAMTFNREETIPAGKIQTYTLMAYTDNFINSSSGASSISTSVPADAAPSNNGSYLRMVFNNVYGLAKTSTDIFVTNYNLLWSDKSAFAFSAHSDINNFSTNDWYNGFGVSSLPLPSQTITAK